MKTTDVRAAALSLSDRDRAELARELIDSLDPATTPLPEGEWSLEWGSEVARRLKQFDVDGEAIEHDVAMSQARQRLAALRR